MLAGVDWGPGAIVKFGDLPAAVLDALVGQPVTVRKTTAGSYHLLALEPTSAPHRIKKSGWRARASQGEELAQRAVDGHRSTAWASPGPGVPEMAFTVDLGRTHALRGVEVRPGLNGRELRLAGSLDGTTWTPLSPLAWAGAVYWTGSELLRNGGPRWAVAFPRTTLRYLRLSPAGPLRDPWTLAEIECLE